MDEKEFDYINVIPLVDIMLVLLTIVLVTASFISLGYLEVKLPKAKEVNFKEETILPQKIIIKEDNSLFWNNKLVTFTELKAYLSSLPNNTFIEIQVDKNAKVEILISVIDILKTYNFQKINLLTEKI